MEEEFNNLEISQISQIKKSANCYFVYSSKDEFVEVEAASVTEAIEKSKVEKPVRVERYVNDLVAFLTHDMIAKKMEEGDQTASTDSISGT